MEPNKTKEFESYLDNYKSRENVLLTCPVCASDFYRTKHFLQDKVIRLGHKTYCSQTCRLSIQSTSMMMPCTNCGKETKKTPCELKKSKTGNVFCSRSCATSKTNLKPKRKRSKTCKSCSNLILSDQAYCKKCFKQTENDWTKITYGEMKSRRIYQVNSQIREIARKAYIKSGQPMICNRKGCGYHLHVDICHIKGISEHDSNTPISVINSLSNLVSLCKNHHWELDHGHLDLCDIQLSY